MNCSGISTFYHRIPSIVDSASSLITLTGLVCDYRWGRVTPTGRRCRPPNDLSACTVNIAVWSLHIQIHLKDQITSLRLPYPSSAWDHALRKADYLTDEPTHGSSSPSPDTCFAKRSRVFINRSEPSNVCSRYVSMPHRLVATPKRMGEGWLVRVNGQGDGARLMSVTALGSSKCYTIMVGGRTLLPVYLGLGSG